MARWLKLDSGIFGDEKISIIRAMPEGDALFTLWIGLLCIGMRRESDLLYVAEGMVYDSKSISKVLDIDEMVVAIGLKTFVGLGMISVLDDGAIRITNFDNHQALDKLETSRKLHAVRQRKYRERQLESPESKVTRHVTSSVTPSDATDLDLDLDKDKEKSPAYSAGFESLWTLYPRKTNKKGAYKAYKARLRDGIEHGELERAVKGYLQASKGTEEQYVLHGATFFGPNERWKEFMDYRPRVAAGAAVLQGWKCKKCGKEQNHTGSYCLGCGGDR